MDSGSTLLCAVPATFADNGDVDISRYRRLLEHLFERGIRSVFVCGTTGEFTALDNRERAMFTRCALSVFGPGGVFAHVGAATARQACRLVELVATEGVTQYSAITPYFLPAGPSAVFDYFSALDAIVGSATLIPYLFAAHTTTRIESHQVTALGVLDSVGGLKVSGEPLDRIRDYVTAAPNSWRVYSGNDVDYAELLDIGAAGVVSGVSSVFPEVFVTMERALARGDKAIVQRSRTKIMEATSAVGGGDIGLIKLGLEMRGLANGPLRVAIDTPSKAAVAKLTTVIERLGDGT